VTGRMRGRLGTTLLRWSPSLTSFLTRTQEEMQTESRVEELARKKGQLQALRHLVDQNTRELAAARKQVMRDNLRQAAQARAQAAGESEGG